MWNAKCTAVDVGRPEDDQFGIWVEFTDLDDPSRTINHEFRFDRLSTVPQIKAAVIAYKESIEEMDEDHETIRNLVGVEITI